MTRSGYIEKADLLAILRSRHLDSRADWVDRSLPDRIDTSKNASLLRTLDIDVTGPAAGPQAAGPVTTSPPREPAGS